MYTSVVFSLCALYPAMYWLIYIGTVLVCLVVGTVSIAGLLVMVSSELVVLLIVCVGINTGSEQQGELRAGSDSVLQFDCFHTQTEFCYDEDPDDSSCNFNDFFNGTDRNRNNDNSKCVKTTLNCDGENCKKD